MQLLNSFDRINYCIVCGKLSKKKNAEKIKKNLLQHSQPFNSVETDWRVAKFSVLQISGRVALKMCRNIFSCVFFG